MAAPPIALTIAGSDCSAGAGIQADLKTFAALGVHGLTVLSAVVSETPLEVAEIHKVPAELVRSQLAILLKTYPVSAIKTGMLSSRVHIVGVAELLASHKIPLVVDPVMIATSGTPLLAESAIAALAERLLPQADVITPNLPEATVLLGEEESGRPEEMAEALAEKFGCSVLLTGGHSPGASKALDLLWHEGELHRYEADWIDLPSSHGTGCTVSAALAAGLARGQALPEAVETAKRFVTEALRGAYQWEMADGAPLLALDQVQRGDQKEI